MFSKDQNQIKPQKHFRPCTYLFIYLFIFNLFIADKFDFDLQLD